MITEANYVVFVTSVSCEEEPDIFRYNLVERIRDTVDGMYHYYDSSVLIDWKSEICKVNGKPERICSYTLGDSYGSETPCDPESLIKYTSDMPLDIAHGQIDFLRGIKIENY